MPTDERRPHDHTVQAAQRDPHSRMAFKGAGSRLTQAIVKAFGRNESESWDRERDLFSLTGQGVLKRSRSASRDACHRALSTVRIGRWASSAIFRTRSRYCTQNSDVYCVRRRVSPSVASAR